MFNDVMPPGKRLRPKPKGTVEPLLQPKQLPVVGQARPNQASFKTPEEAARDEATQNVISDKPEATKPAEKTSKLSKFKLSWPPTRKQQIIGGILIVVVAFGIGAAWTLTHHKRAVVAVTPAKPKVAKKAAPVVIYSTLTGLPVPDESVNKRTVTGVMIENSLDARPQSGLSEAGVVFEAVAEGGVTRFLALFQDTAPDNIGPIRSARPYYVQWAMGFDAAYAHVGGSPDALSDITSWGVKDMNQFYNGNYYHRTNDRAAPHNVYTGIATLNKLEASKGYTSTFTGFTRKKEQPYKAPTPPPPATTGSKAPPKPATPTDTRTPANSIDFGLSGYTYDPHYDYNPATNSYDRTEAGQPHIDANGNKRISPKVVIAITVPLQRGALDSSGAYYSDYNVIGSGTAYIFQDGTVTTATWNKTANNAPLTFTDSAGKPFGLNPGQTWISAVTGPDKVVYK